MDNVLTVPNRAIHASNGQRTVTILYEGQQISIPVTVGLVNDTMSEVTSDQLREGDTVVIGGSTSTKTTSSNTRNNLNFGGAAGDFNGPPPAGLP